MVSESIQAFAPSICPQCQGERTFIVRAERIACRRCGYTLRHDDGRPITLADKERRHRRTAPPEEDTLIASYRITHIGPVNSWARAAFNTGQDHIHRREWDEALKAFFRSLESQSDFVDAHLWVARLVDDPEVKREHLARILSQQPGHLEAVKMLMILNGELTPEAARIASDPFAEPVRRAAGGVVGTETENLRCERCGSPNMTNDDVTGLAVCDSCGYAQEPSTAGVERRQANLLASLLIQRSKPVRWVIGERLLHCNSCGAERTIAARQLSKRCPFCGSNHVITKDALNSFRQPDGLVPFVVSRDEASDLIKDRLSSPWERLRGWFAKSRIERATLTGMYLPYWIFDASLEVRLTFEPRSRGNNQAISPFGHSARRVYTPEPITQSDAMTGIGICAVESPPRLLTDRLGDFNLSPIIAYEPSLLARHSAELYGVDFDQASLIARRIISEHMRAAYRERYPDSRAMTTVRQMTFQLVLKPVWVGTLYRDDAHMRSALVNGQTGQVALGSPHPLPPDRAR